MLILNVDKISKNFGFGQLFKDVSFSLNDGESLSIVGPNGCGKSTILKMIAGLERIDSGAINIKKGAKVAYLDQVGSSNDDPRCVSEILQDAFSDLKNMEIRLNELQDMMGKEMPSQKLEQVIQSYCNLLEKFTELGGYDIERNINAVVDGLEINKCMLGKSFNDLSGGEKTLVQLAKALLMKPDLLLLDEPTNHLDIARIEWLEGYLKTFKGATVVVSHDRYFLDRMSNKILSIDGGIAKIYTTNYSGYLAERERDFQKQMAEYKDQQLAMKRLEEQIKYFAERGMTKNSSTLCDRAHSLQTQLERMKKNAVEKPKEARRINMGFVEERKNSKRVISAEHFSVNLPNGKALLSDVSLNICSGERVAYIGNNGSGKSTFVKAIMGMCGLPCEGQIIVGPSSKIGYLPQIIEFENAEQSLLEHFKESAVVNEQKARQILSAFQFYKEDVNKKVKNLSGGEKIRVKLAELLQQKINTLIFDEPTNHIDIPTKEVLEDAIADFDGTLIFVSHDRYFINKFAEKVFEFESGKINMFLGNYDSYKDEKKQMQPSNHENVNGKIL